MAANIGGHAIHLDIGDGALRRLILIGYLLEIHTFEPKEFPNSPPSAVVNRITMLELLDERLDLPPRPAQHKMHMIGHQDKRQHDHIWTARRLDSHEIHAHPEILIIPEP